MGDVDIFEKFFKADTLKMDEYFIKLSSWKQKFNWRTIKK